MKNNKINYRAILKVLIDGCCWSLITIISYIMRLENSFTLYLYDISIVMVVIAPIKFILIIANKHHKISWRYTSMQDFKVPIISIAYMTFVYFAFYIIVQGRIFIPRSVPLIDAMISIIVFLLIRMSAQYVDARKKRTNHYSEKVKKVLIVGAGDSGSMVAKEILRYPEMGMIPIGYLDDDPNKQKQLISNVQVLGKIDEIEKIVYENEVDEIIIAMAVASGTVIRNILNKANELNIHCRTIPSFNEVISGNVAITQLREVQVEDLLRRKPVDLDKSKIKEYLKGKSILVSGAGGSIGSEIVRQICTFLPKKVVLLGRGENSIHEIYREISREYQHIDIVPVITDVRDKTSLEFVFQKHQPDVVFHAAAHKHVYLMESNPCQAILNNIIGTKNLVDLSLDENVKTFVNISTDKAINPTSVMGASKRVAEYIVEDASKKINDGRNYVSVRFGNVLGSRGSVIPIFKEQIERGGPVTVTHPEMKRYFMTIPEASQLVLQAGALNKNGAVFVLDMGEPVKIVDMARDLIRLSGLEPDKDISIAFTGMKPGEKLYEELLNAEEGTNMTQHESIFVAKKDSYPQNLDKNIQEMLKVAKTYDSLEIRKMIKKIVPTYTGIGE